nr:hypothetical protein [uncultured Mediterranean phage uvMED]
MITKKINLKKSPSITVHYCTGIDEAYYKIKWDHGFEIKQQLTTEDDTVHGFTITDEIDDFIHIYLDATLPKELYIKSAVHEGLQAALSVVRRKAFYSFDDSIPITIGEDPDFDETILEILSLIIAKVLIANEKEEE